MANSAVNISPNNTYLGSAQITSAFSSTNTAVTDITGLSVTVTIPSGAQKIKISFSAHYMRSSNGSGTGLTLDIYDSTAGAGIAAHTASNIGANYANDCDFFVIHSPAPGTRTYKIRYSQGAAGTFVLDAGALFPATLLVEALY